MRRFFHMIPDPAPQDVDDLIFGQDGPRVSER